MKTNDLWIRFEARVKAGKCPICGRQVTSQDLTKTDKNVNSKEIHWKEGIFIRVCETHPLRDYKGRDILEKFRDSYAIKV